jgi:hypothetical protein
MLDTERIQNVLSKAGALAASTSEDFVLAIVATYAAGYKAGLEAGKASGQPAA